MKVERKSTEGGDFFKKGVDLRDGDTTQILDAGRTIEGKFGEQHVFKVKTLNGEKDASFNQTSLNVMIDEHGDDTENWVGKPAKIFILKQNVSGQFRDIAYFAPPNYVFGSNGLEKEQSSPTAVSPHNDNLPTGDELSNGDGVDY